jgi:hypothetical protein
VKNKPLPCIVPKLTALSLALMLNSTPTQAAIPGDIQPCWQGSTMFFLNGVQTTEEEAYKNIDYLKSIYKDRMPDGTPLSYELLYNHTNGLQDFLEVFEQRKQEYLDGQYQPYIEWFFDSMTGDGPVKASAVADFPESQAFFDQLLEAYKTSAVEDAIKLHDKMNDLPSAQVDYAEHRAILDKYALESDRMLFVAHSQAIYS